MDDYLECFSSEERAIDTIQKVISILSNDGFRLTKWLSNNKNILKSVLPNWTFSKNYLLRFRQYFSGESTGYYMGSSKEYAPHERYNQKRGINKERIIKFC